jgi:hypothetical protein
MRRALLVVDMTNDFLLKSYNPGLALERGIELVPRIRKLQEVFLNSRKPVIYATDRHLKTDFELKKWGPHSMKGTKGSEIVHGLLTKGLCVMERDWKKKDVKRIKKDQLLPSFSKIEEKFMDKAIININKDLEFEGFQEQMEMLNTLKNQRLSPEEHGLKILQENLKQANCGIKVEEIFEYLVEGDIDMMFNILTGRQTTLKSGLEKWTS